MGEILGVLTSWYCVGCCYCCRVFCVAPPHITTFSRLFGAYSSARNWNAAVKVLAQLDLQMSKR